MTLGEDTALLVQDRINRQLERASRYASASSSPATRRGYGADWRTFEAWCEAEGHRQPMPASPETLALYITHLADSGRKASTIGRALAAISKAHKLAHQNVPTSDVRVKRVWDGIRRTLGIAPKKKAPITPKAFAAAFATLPTGLAGVRDRALLMLGFAGGFRRGELVGLNVEDITFADEGLRVSLGRSKTDQFGEGRPVGIPRGRRRSTCPVLLLQRWLELSGITEGPLFRGVNRHGQLQKKRLSTSTVARKVKVAARAAGLKEEDFAGHSLRSGFVTAAYRANKKDADIMRQTGHKRVQTLQGYVRDAHLFRNNAAEGLY